VGEGEEGEDRDSRTLFIQLSFRLCVLADANIGAQFLSYSLPTAGQQLQRGHRSSPARSESG